MILIFEGMDRCGKDTQIRNVTKHLIEKNSNKSVHVMHYSSLPITFEPSDPLSYGRIAAIQYLDMFRIMDLVSNNTDIHLILNRAHLGEMVYGFIYRHYDASWIFSDIELHFKELLKKIKLIVLVDSSLKSVTERDDGLSLSNKDLDKAQIEVDRFILAYNKSHIKNKLLIDIKSNDMEETQKEILEFVDKNVL